MSQSTSEKLFARARQVIPGGVNSPVRAFRSVNLEPPFIIRGRGSKIYDVDGREYIDYVGSWGPMILGHAHPAVVNAVRDRVGRGASFGAPTILEIEMAEELCAALPAMEMVRMVNSGTEATMSAIRLARGFTGRDKIIKFAGCYHGHVDALLVAAGSGATTLGVPDSAGVPAAFTSGTLSAPFNDLDAVDRLFSACPGEIAAIIVEPVAGNMGTIPPTPGFLGGLRERCRKHETLLIFDEVMTGFRVAFGGAQILYDVKPDLTCLGKIIGGGLPVGAFGGRREIMEKLAPLGAVYQAGTLSGNPLAMAAGLETLRVLKNENPYPRLENNCARLAAGIDQLFREATVKHYSTRVGSMFCTYFTEGPVLNYDDARKADTAAFSRFFAGLLKRGIYMAPSQFEAAFLSAAHSPEDIDQTLSAVQEALSEI
ncbi:MAG: glutamate-1-semialdehyde 2,1-aminomutase [Deltaproteobacteria bacterium]|nr:glutamate-1-semialdehyde 2,1-aminomutase [Deltaproteobacteria bacterium]